MKLKISRSAHMWTWQNKALSIMLALIMALTFVLGATGLAKADTGDADQIILSWTEDTSNSQAVRWRNSKTENENFVQYKIDNGNNDFSAATKTKATKKDWDADYSHFEVTMKDLKPNTKYSYRVGSEDKWSETKSFTTGNNSNDKFKFMFMGDVQEGYTEWGNLLKKAYADNPDLKFGLMAGDMVDQASSKSDYNTFLQAASPVFQSIPMMPTIGNHEIGTYAISPTRKPEMYLDHFNLPKNGPQGYEEEFYSFDYGNCHFIVLSSNYMNPTESYVNEGDAKKVANWIEKDLDDNQKTWTIALFHHPAYPIVTDKCAEPIRKNWMPLLENGGVDLVLCGHQHQYMRTHPMLSPDDIVDPDEGIVQIMGNAGSKYYYNTTGPYHIDVIRGGISCYQVLEVDNNKLQVNTYTTSGEKIDSWERDKTNAPSKDRKLKVKGTVNASLYNSNNNYAAITLTDVEFPTNTNQAVLNWKGEKYTLFQATNPYNNGKNRLVVYIPSTDIINASQEDIINAIKCNNTGANMFTYGEIIEDGKIDISDAVKGLYLIKKNPIEPKSKEFYALDVNGDNKIDKTDVEQILAYYLSGTKFSVWQ